MFLTDAQVHHLTDREQSARQIEWLRDNGYPFDVSAAGRPRVLVSYVERRLGGERTDVKSESKEPNFAFLHKKRA